MTNKRIKVEHKPIVNNDEPKVRPKSDKIMTNKVEKVLSEMTPSEKIDNRRVLTDNSFERHKAFGDIKKKAEINEKVKQGLLKWAFYGVENDHEYQYYLKIKK